MHHKHTYLVGVDNSDASMKAIEWVEGVLDPDRDRVILAHVTEPSTTDYRGTMRGWMKDHALRHSEIVSENEEIEHEMGETLSRFRDRGFDVEPVLIRGEVGKVLCRVADSNDVDVIVLGRRGLSVFREWILGESVSNYVIHHAPCPVLVIPREEHLPDHSSIDDLPLPAYM